MKTLNNNQTIVGTRKKGVFIAAAIAALCLVATLICCTGCSGDGQDEVGDMAKAYSQRLSELTFTCTQGKSDAVVEVSLRDADLGFSLSVPAGEELGKTTDRFTAM